MLRSILLVDENNYLSLVHIDESLLAYQNWKEYYKEEKLSDGSMGFKLPSKFNNTVIKADERGEYPQFDYSKHYPYFDTNTSSIKYDEEKYQVEMKKYQEKQEKEKELKDLNTYFSWFNTQAVQHEVGTINDEDWLALLDEYKAKSTRAKDLKNELGIQTETQIREAKLKLERRK